MAPNEPTGVRVPETRVPEARVRLEDGILDVVEIPERVRVRVVDVDEDLIYGAPVIEKVWTRGDDGEPAVLSRVERDSEEAPGHIPHEGCCRDAPAARGRGCVS